MHLKFRNVNQAFAELVGLFNDEARWAEEDCKIVRKPSRNGDVLMIEEPVLITYTHPRERVLFNAARDASPGFHIYEALWMLAGRNDLAPLKFYVPNFYQFSDDGKTLNGSYGYRWRHAMDYDWVAGWYERDQLTTLVNHLKAEPNSRRAVLSMWNVVNDLHYLGSGPCKMCHDSTEARPSCNHCHGTGKESYSKDLCCNLAVMFSLREIVNGADDAYDRQRGARPPCYVLDMTVTNRSNDMILGALGANLVHFSILQEYMAARIGVEVGVYNQFTTNLHVYTWNWKPEEWLAADKTKELAKECQYSDLAMVPLIKDPVVFERELPDFVGAFSGEEEPWSCVPEWEEPFFQDVAGPLLTAFRCHKQGMSGEALAWTAKVKADDWCIAMTNWVQRRIDRRKAKDAAQSVQEAD